MIEKIALAAAVILPMWNIPMVVRIVKRKSSGDISIYWAVGVWVCLALMAPQAFNSPDIVWRVFGIMNFVFFTAVLVAVLAYRNR